MLQRLRRRPIREPRFAPPRGVPLEHDLDERLVAEADQSHRSVAAVARDAIARGLPLVRRARLKRERLAARLAGDVRDP